MKRKVNKSKKTYSLGKTAGEMVAKKKTVTKKDGSVKTIDKYKTKGGGKGKTKSRVIEKMESAAGGKTTIESKTRNKRYSSKAIPKKRVTKIEGVTKYNVGPDRMTEFKTTSKTTKKGSSMKKYGASGYVSDAQRKAVHASKAEKKGASMKKYGASKKEFPEIKKGNEGKFTKWVEKNMPGMDTCKAASKIMRSKTKKYSSSVVKMANYANNFGCKAKKDGSSMDHGKKGGASFNPKLRKAVADGKIKGKFADAVMRGSKK